MSVDLSMKLRRDLGFTLVALLPAGPLLTYLPKDNFCVEAIDLGGSTMLTRASFSSESCGVVSFNVESASLFSYILIAPL